MIRRKFVITFERPDRLDGEIKVPDNWDEMSEDDKFEYLDEYVNFDYLGELYIDTRREVVST